MMKFLVENMTCGHCVKAVSNAVQQADAQAQVAVDLATKSVEVKSTLAVETVITLLAEEGYPAQRAD
ncbi:MAG: copper resistance protein CopZ [Acinetobacter sp.]|jgi:copper chaperone|nr:MAG: copper resistance protein CopZ [Acinetobacter sp.]